MVDELDDAGTAHPDDTSTEPETDDQIEPVTDDDAPLPDEEDGDAPDEDVLTADPYPGYPAEVQDFTPAEFGEWLAEQKIAERTKPQARQEPTDAEPPSYDKLVQTEAYKLFTRQCRMQGFEYDGHALDLSDPEDARLQLMFNACHEEAGDRVSANLRSAHLEREVNEGLAPQAVLRDIGKQLPALGFAKTAPEAVWQAIQDAGEGITAADWQQTPPEMKAFVLKLAGKAAQADLPQTRKERLQKRQIVTEGGREIVKTPTSTATRKETGVDAELQRMVRTAVANDPTIASLPREKQLEIARIVRQSRGGR